MFCRNSSQQISLNDPINNMPNYLKNILKKSWAHNFQKYIFPNINEERFSVLYSDNYASRPNSPVNVIVGLLIIKELFALADEDLIGSLHFDIRYQYALRTTSFEKQPVSINSLYNFRSRLYDYYKKTGIDLIQQEVESLSQTIAKYLKVDNKTVRMDSFMVSSSCKKLSRIELVYSVNAKFIKLLNKIDDTLIPEECKAYLQKGNKNETIYKTKDSESESKLEFLLKQSQLLHETGLKSTKQITNSKEFLLLSRMIDEQLNTNKTGTASVKEGSKISPESLQNPTDPDATYRTKYGGNIGYIANVSEAFNDNNSVITTYDFKPNTYSDSKFADEVIEKLQKEKSDSENIKLIADGAYYEQEKAEKASSKGIELIPGELVGRKPSKDKISYAKFKIDLKENKITECPNGIKPVQSYYKSRAYTAKFSKKECRGCPYYDNCPIKKQKKFNTIRVSEKRYKTEIQREKMATPDYIQLTNQRAGIEGIPSVFRRKYHVDSMPIRGLVRSKIWFGFKVAAYNVKKLLKGVLNSRLYACIKVLMDIFNISIEKLLIRNSMFNDISFSSLLFVG